MNDAPIANDQCPVVVMRMRGAGVIALMNPRAVSLLVGLGLPLRADQGWAILEGLVPAVCDLVRAQLLEPGPVAEQRPVGRRDPQGRLHHLALAAIVVNADSCMVAIEDVTSRVLQERQLARERRRWTSTSSSASTTATAMTAATRCCATSAHR